MTAEHGSSFRTIFIKKPDDPIAAIRYGTNKIVRDHRSIHGFVASMEPGVHVRFSLLQICDKKMTPFIDILSPVT